jgi:hypothetical protein
MSISRRSVIAGAAAGGALLALNMPGAHARDRFVAAAVEPTIKKVPTPAVGHAIVRGSSKTSLSSIDSVTISPWNNIIPGYGDYNLNGDSWGTSRVCISAFDSEGNPVMSAKPAGSEAVRGFYAEGRIYVPLIDPSQPAAHKELWNRTAVWESDARSENWTLRDIRDPKGQPYKAEHIWSLCSAPATNGTLFITISSHKDDVHGLSYEDGVILAGDFEGGFVPIYISSAPNQTIRLLETDKQSAAGGNITVRATRNIRGGGKENIIVILAEHAPKRAVIDDGMRRHHITNPAVHSDAHYFDHDWGISDAFVDSVTPSGSDVHEFADGWYFEPGNIAADRNIKGIQGYIRHRKDKGINLAIPNESNVQKDMGITHTYMRSNLPGWHAIRSQFGDLTIIDTQNKQAWHVNKGDYKRYLSADTKDKYRNELLKVTGDSFAVITTNNSANPKLVFGTRDGNLLYIEGLLPYMEAKDMRRTAVSGGWFPSQFSDDYEYETYKFGMSYSEYRKNERADIAKAQSLKLANGVRPRSYYKRIAD